MKKLNLCHLFFLKQSLMLTFAYISHIYRIYIYIYIYLLSFSMQMQWMSRFSKHIFWFSSLNCSFVGHWEGKKTETFKQMSSFFHVELLVKVASQLWNMYWIRRLIPWVFTPEVEICYLKTFCSCLDILIVLMWFRFVVLHFSLKIAATSRSSSPPRQSKILERFFPAAHLFNICVLDKSTAAVMLFAARILW